MIMLNRIRRFLNQPCYDSNSDFRLRSGKNGIPGKKGKGQHMAIEVEAKYRLNDGADTLRQHLFQKNAAGRPDYEVADTYLRHPSRDFAQTGEAYRIRREGGRTCLTYKGPKQKAVGVKTREEIEFGLEPDDSVYPQALAMFTAMGFTEVLTVRKFREPFELRFGSTDATIVIDDAGELGFFAEIELVLEDGADPATAEATIRAIAGELGLTDYEPKSYLRLWLERLKML